MKPYKSISLFASNMTSQTQAEIKNYLDEYLKGSTLRTQAEEDILKTEGKSRRAEGLYLPSDGIILKAYTQLIQDNPALQLVSIHTDLLGGKKSMVPDLRSSSV